MDERLSIDVRKKSAERFLKALNIPPYISWSVALEIATERLTKKE
jgi:hypothetical protein